jgi:hypothetical protein
VVGIVGEGGVVRLSSAATLLLSDLIWALALALLCASGDFAPAKAIGMTSSPRTAAPNRA